MSWIENIQTEYRITTGDGAVFTPNWLNASKAVEYNVAQFEFPNLSGSLVVRGTPKGARYNLEIYFQGADHLSISRSFEQSSANPDPWRIEHPFYGSLYVQPLGLVFDNSSYNVTKITGTLVETITEDAPKSNIAAEDKILEDKETTDDLLSQSNANEVLAPKVADVQEMKENVKSTYAEGAKKVKTNLDAERYFNAFNTANSYINKATSAPLAAMREIQAVLSYPAQFADGVKNRLNTLLDQFKLLRNTLENILSKPSKRSKKLYEHNAGTAITTMIATTVTNVSTSSVAGQGDYNNRTVIAETVEFILNRYNEYLTDLDTLQSDNASTPDSYIPDAVSMMAISQLVSLAVTHLLSLAQGSRQERTIFLEDDTDLITLADRLYGLSSDDSTIEVLISTNSIGPNEIFELKKGRGIVYYV